MSQAENPKSSRIASLDIIRGISILAILLMNIQSFSMPAAAYSNPTAYGNLDSANLLFWAFCHLFVDLKFISIFAMLFGAGIILLSEKSAPNSIDSLSFFRRRMLWLGLAGLLHGYFIWYGDILFSYAVCGYFAWHLRRLTIKHLWLAGLGLIAAGSLPTVLLQISLPWLGPDELWLLKQSWQPGQPLVDQEIAAYLGSWWDALRYRAPLTFSLQSEIFLFYTFWRVSGLMLIGMALYKQQVFFSETTLPFHFILPLIVSGLFITALGAGFNFEQLWSADFSPGYGYLFNYCGSIPTSIGYLLLATRLSAIFTCRRLTAIGRMALSNYLFQSLACSFIFYGFGLGLFAGVERWQLLPMVLIIWGAQLQISYHWLQYFGSGPFERLWRNFCYRQ